ncbi:YceI family protein [uncultured Tateyamaria sp.]|uniref:YceI family protein n=1 Tax=uncultured Tateyamaria sp. TaxID=455651 RepID=UPI002629FFD9|nr:YceI family protein [uncultured Tateyamaria sp.]
MFFKRIAAMGVGLALSVTAAQAGTWTLDGAASQLAFGSIKFNDTGEVHSFGSMDGSVAEDGTVRLGVDLSSVETNIDIRNERMIEHVFKNAPGAAISAQVDMAALDKMPVGDSTVMEVEGTLELLGVEVPLYGDMFVMRLTEDKVMVTTDSMMFLSTVDAGIEAGVDKLMELASLPNIVRTAPVTLRLIFDADGTSG